MIFALYRKLSPFLKSISQNLGLSTGTCRYHPTCSNYTQTAISRHGFFRGVLLSTKRMLKCHPWSPGGFDPVPPTK